MRSASLVFASSVLLLSCSSSRQGELDGVMYSWVGQPREALERAWGPPMREIPLTTDGRLLIYHTDQRQDNVPPDDAVRTMLQRCRLEVETDRYGKIVSWRFQSECY